MLILAVESTAVTASAALTEGETLIAQFTVNNTLTHSETLLPMIKTMLAAAGKKTGDIDLFACAAGPGSFTGVRIGVATIKGLAFGSGKPCVGVSSLEALALNLDFIKDAAICPVMDARRGQVYCAVYINGRQIKKDRAAPLGELSDNLEALSLPVYFIGDGYKLACDNIKLTAPIFPAPELLRRQSAYSVAKAAYKKYLNCPGQFPDYILAPIYLRPSQAEREASEKYPGSG